MKKCRLLTILIIITFMLSGCASMVSRSEYSVSIKSSPHQALFSVTNKEGEKIHNGKTPETISLKSGNGFFKKSEYTVTFSKDGYEDKTVNIVATMDGWYAANILVGGLIGWLIVDPVTGAMWKLPDMVSTSLEEQASTLNEDEALLKFVTINDIPEEYRKNLVRIQ